VQAGKTLKDKNDRLSKPYNANLRGRGAKTSVKDGFTEKPKGKSGTTLSPAAQAAKDKIKKNIAARRSKKDKS
jgi:hypothetical protein